MNINLARRPNKIRVRKAFEQLVQKYKLTGPLTAKDFYKICFSEGWHVLRGSRYAEYSKLPIAQGVQGATLKIHGKRMIWLRSLFEEKKTELDLRTCAHEIGHALLHSSNEAFLARMTSYEAYRSHPHEVEAEMFADLLMDPFEIAAAGAIDGATCLER